MNSHKVFFVPILLYTTNLYIHLTIHKYATAIVIVQNKHSRHASMLVMYTHTKASIHTGGHTPAHQCPQQHMPLQLTIVLNYQG